MLDILLFLPRVIAWVFSPLTGYNPFKKKRTATLPEHIFQVSIGPMFGVAMKPLLKEIESIFGPDLEESINIVDSVKVRHYCGLSPPTYSTPEELVEYCQGTTGEERMFRSQRLRTPQLLISGECLDKLTKCKHIHVYAEHEYTTSVYECFRAAKAELFLTAATKVLEARGGIDSECCECEVSVLDTGIDSDGDCNNCGWNYIERALLQDTITKLQKEAA